MKITSLAVAAVGAAAAVTTGFVSYEAFAPAETVAEASAPATDASRPGRVTRFAPCPKDTEPRGKTCLRTEERTVTEYVTAAPVTVQQVGAPTDPVDRSGPGGDRRTVRDDHPSPDEDHGHDDSDDDRDDHHDDHHGGDDGDDDHHGDDGEDGHHGDDDDDSDDDRDDDSDDDRDDDRDDDPDDDRDDDRDDD